MSPVNVETAIGSIPYCYKTVSGQEQHQEYDPFGNVVASTGTLQQPYQWSSKESDGNGLVYYLYRFYSPTLGRWVNRDPNNEQGGINLLEAFENNPIPSVDSWGLDLIISDQDTIQQLEKFRDDALKNFDALSGKYPHAAANFKHYFDNTGTPIIEDATWLESFKPITNAMEINRQRFINEPASELGSKENKKTITQWVQENIKSCPNSVKVPSIVWDKGLYADYDTDLYFASGGSTIRATGDFVATCVCCSDNKVNIKGTIKWHWYDIYNWDRERRRFFPDGTLVYDSAFVKLKQVDNSGADFNMSADWTEQYSFDVSYSCNNKGNK